MVVEELESFCGNEQFWDNQLTWNTSHPDFTECFQKTTLSWVPCVLLWLTAPIEVYILRITKNGRIPWTILNVTKTVLCFALCLLSLVNLSNSVAKWSSGEIVPEVDFFTPSFSFITYVLVLFFTVMERLKGVQSSGVQFFFWLVAALCDGLIYRSFILRALDEESLIDEIAYVVQVVKYPLIAVLFLLTWVSDAVPKKIKIRKVDKGERPCPELSASFPSYLLFTWLDSIVYTGYKRDLEREDLWDLNPPNKSKPVYETFNRHWRHELKRVSRGLSRKSFSDNSVEYSAFKQEITLETKVNDYSDFPNLLKVLVKSYGHIYFFAIFLKLVSDFLLFVNPLILSLLISFVDSDEPKWKGFLYASTMLFVAILNVTLVARGSHLSYLVGMRLRSALIGAIYRKSLRLSNSAKRNYTLGDVVNLMSVDVQRLMDVVIYFMFVCTSPILFCVTMYLLWQQIGVAVLSGVAAMIFSQSITVFVLGYAKRLQMDQMKLKDSRIRLMSEILNGIKVLKLYGWEKCFMNIINKIRTEEVSVLRKSSSFGLAMTFSWYASGVLTTLSSFATYVLIDSTHVLDANIAFVSFALFNVLQAPIMLMPMVIVTMIQASVSMKRISRFLYCDEIDPDAIQYVHDDENAITVENGHFHWGDPSNIILRDMNLRVKHGSLVAIVGTVGAGKSSLVSALLGEMEKARGSVRVSGSLAYVSQQAWMQNATIRDNILFGNHFNAPFYHKVVEACALKPDLQILPAGDCTEIGEKGINLSGGQKQRISLARAVYADAENYLFDDPLSAVDVHVGKHIFDKLIGPKGLLKDKTRVLVTHRITILPQVDLIVVVNDGAISEVGTYRELLDRKGVFSNFLMTYLTEAEEYDMEKAEDGDVVKDGIPIISTPAANDKSLSKSLEFTESGSRNFLRQESVPNLISGSNPDRMSPDHYSNPLQRNSDFYSVTNLSIESLSRHHSLIIGEASTIVAVSDNEHNVAANDGTLIVAEVAECGKVKGSTYIHYARSVGFKTIFITLFFYLIAYGCSMGSSIWLSMWSNDRPNSDGMQDTALRDLRLIVYGLLGFSFASLSLVAGVVFVYGTTYASRNIHMTLLNNVLRSPMSFFDTTPLGRIINRFSKDVDVLDVTVPQILQQWLTSLFQVLATIIVISLSTPLFGVVVLPVAIIYYILQRFYVSTSRQLKRMESITRSPIYSHFSETVTGAAIIRAFARQKTFIRQSEEKVDENQLCYYPSIISNRWIGIRLEIIGNVLVFCAAVLAVLGRETLSPGLVGLSVSYSLSITFLLNWVVRMSSEVETNVVAIERIKEYTSIPTEAAWEIIETKPPYDWPTKGEVAFDRYSTRYREGLDLVLRKATCSIESGKKVGIVGRTGAGKSSLTLALFRIIEAVSGNIMIDGIDIAKLGLHDLRSRLTIIPQDPVLFSGTLRMNLDPFEYHTDEEIWKVLELAHLKGYASTLVEGLLYEISEGGENLSVGQRQLVCLARALLRKTKILILDEATAAVDLETDDLIQATIRKEFADCTVLTIAHRLNTIIDNDQVMVLDHGIIKEFDSPTSLIDNKNSIFYSMAKDAGLA